MKKLLLLSVMAVMALTVSAQQKFDPKDVSLSRQKISHKAEVKRSFQAAEFRNEPVAIKHRPLRMLSLDASRIQPVKHTRALPVMMERQAKMVNTKGRLASWMVSNLKPTMTVQANAPRKAPTFRDSYTGKATDYFSKVDTAWVMQPAAAQLEDGTSVNVLVDVIPLTPQLKAALSALYPNGVPVEYTIEDGAITIKPQAIASYENEGVKNYITLFCANSDDEDGVIRMQLADDGLLKVVNGNWIALGEFAGVPFDEDMGDSEAFIGLDELYAGVRYVYDGQPQGFTSQRDYSGHGVDIHASQPVDWTMGLGTWAEDGDEFPAFFNVTPFDPMFAGLYPDGIPVEYTKDGDTYTIKPQVLATLTDEAGNAEYLMIFSATNEATGEIVFKIDENGKLTTIKDESIMIGSWLTKQYDPTFETFTGWYTYTDRVSYRLPSDPPVAPGDLGADPNELILFAGMSLSGYGYGDNLGLIGAYAPLNFRNTTFDIATNFEWSVLESVDDEENVITGTDRNFTFTTKGDAVYENLTLKGFNQDAASEPYTFGYGHCPVYNEKNEPTEELRYEAAYFYAGGAASMFQFQNDGSYATMTRQNPDNDLTFYINWATPDILVPAGGPTINKIYSYQGKPATPLFITGVSIPMVEFKANDDFNLHIGLYKCSRSATGVLTVGDLIAEGDATAENVDDQLALPAVVFDELYVEDEFGMSESLDYLFIEDEFVIVIEGFDNGTFSGVIASQGIDNRGPKSSWYTIPGDSRLRSYGYNPDLFIGLLGATYGYLHTEDNTNLTFAKEGSSATIHIEPMLYNVDEETEEVSRALYVESVTVDGEEAEDVPEWLGIDFANEDYTTAVEYNEAGEPYEYFVNGIDYDMVLTAEALPEGVEGRTAEIVFMQAGARLTVKVAQGAVQGITTVVTKKQLKNGHTYNLAGQRIGAVKGVVLKDGRKVIVK